MFLTLSQNISGPTKFLKFHVFTVFPDTFQFLPREFLIFVCQYSRHMSCLTVYIYHFFSFFSVSHHIPVPNMWDSHFPRLSVFSTYSRHYSACASFHTFLRFLALFQVLLCTYLIFHVFDSFSKYFRSYNVSKIPRFQVFLDTFQFLPREFFIFICQYSCHMSCPTVYIHQFSCFSVFLAIFQLLSCEILIFLVCQFSSHIPGPTVCVSHFSRFSAFLAIFPVLQCVCLIFQVFPLF